MTKQEVIQIKKQFIITEQIKLSPNYIYIIRQGVCSWLAETNDTAREFKYPYEVEKHETWNFSNKLKCLNSSLYKYSLENRLPYNEPELLYRSTPWEMKGGDAFCLTTKDLESNDRGEICSISKDDNKSIVFYGNLFREGYSEKEIFIIFAHELGHYTEDLWESSPLFRTEKYETKEHRADYFSGFFCRMAGVNITQENIDNLFYRGSPIENQIRERMFESGRNDYAVYHGSQISDL